MHFISGIIAIHATASALNNGKGEDNVGKVKSIRVGRHDYPYVSAQALRYWLRGTLAETDPNWRTAPVLRGKGAKQQSYTEGDPLQYWDDDLFGYMRAEKEEAITRVAPFRTSTLVSVSPVEITQDYGVMARAEGNSILFEHEFYRATLVGIFSIDLSAVGTFTQREKPGYRNLTAALMQQAKHELEYLPSRDAYRLPLEARMSRVSSLLRALGRLQGGAKQTLHYTDVTPVFTCMVALQGGNNPFGYLVDSTPQPRLHEGALDEALTVYGDDFVSPLYVGLRQGFMDSAFEAFAQRNIQPAHPRESFDMLADDLWEHPEWFA